MQNRRSTWRGRPRGKYYSGDDIGLLEYLARISMKYGIDSREFFGKLVGAWKNQESTCKSLTIKCRKRTRDSAIFLIASSYKVVAQFPIPERILQKNNPLKDYAQTMSTERSSVERPKVKHPKIKDLEAGMKQVNLKAKVLEIPEPKLVYTKFGTQAYVSNALIADETGTIRLSLWNQQINAVSVDDVIAIENTRVARFRGERQLRIGRSGKLKVVEDVGFLSTQKLKEDWPR